MSGEISTYLPFVLLEVFDDKGKANEILFDTVDEAKAYAKENNIEVLS